MVRSSAAGTRTRASRRTRAEPDFKDAAGRVRASLRTRNVRLAGVPTDDSMKPETRDQPAATPANARTQDARPRTVDVPDASPASGRTRANCAPSVGQSCGSSGEPPDDRQARGHRAGRRRDPAQGAGHPERAGDGPAASSQARHREDARQPPGGGPLAGGGAGHAPEDRQTSGADALAERHAREGVDRLAAETARGGTWLTSGRPSRSTPRPPCAGGSGRRASSSPSTNIAVDMRWPTDRRAHRIPEVKRRGEDAVLHVELQAPLGAARSLMNANRPPPVYGSGVTRGAGREQSYRTRRRGWPASTRRSRRPRCRTDPGPPRWRHGNVDVTMARELLRVGTDEERRAGDATRAACAAERAANVVVSQVFARDVVRVGVAARGRPQYRMRSPLFSMTNFGVRGGRHRPSRDRIDRRGARRVGRDVPALANSGRVDRVLHDADLEVPVLVGEHGRVAARSMPRDAGRRGSRSRSTCRRSPRQDRRRTARTTHRGQESWSPC